MNLWRICVEFNKSASRNNNSGPNAAEPFTSHIQATRRVLPAAMKHGRAVDATYRGRAAFTLTPSSPTPIMPRLRDCEFEEESHDVLYV